MYLIPSILCEAIRIGCFPRLLWLFSCYSIFLCMSLPWSSEGICSLVLVFSGMWSCNSSSPWWVPPFGLLISLWWVSVGLLLFLLGESAALGAPCDVGSAPCGPGFVWLRFWACAAVWFGRLNVCCGWCPLAGM